MCKLINMKKKYQKYKKEKVCSTPGCETIYSYWGKVCSKCFRKNKIQVDPDYYKRQKRHSYKKEKWSNDECMIWIAKQYDNKFWIDMYGISELITVYDSLGGLQAQLDTLPTGKQLNEMWNYVNNKFLKEYKNVLEMNI